MTKRLSRIRLAIALVGAAVIGTPALAAQDNRPPAALRIVVVEGEDAVNIVQQKTAVAPVVEVRDRNDQPVAGAVVRFAIRNGRATFGGARNLTVVTNAAGRAAASGLVPTGNGALQISATAALQGQTAAITIAQTNVMTLAEAATVSGAGASGGAGASTGAAGGGTGGGLSATTIGVVGGAAAGGVIASKELGLIGGGTKYSGRFGGTVAMKFSGGCTRNEIQSGQLEIEIHEGSATLDGTASVDGNVQIAQPNPCGPPGYTTDSFGVGDMPLSGSTDNMTFKGDHSNNYTDPDGSSGINSYQYTFAGAQNGTEITGTLTVTRTISNSKAPVPGVGSITYSVTLR